MKKLNFLKNISDNIDYGNYLNLEGTIGSSYTGITARTPIDWRQSFSGEITGLHCRRPPEIEGIFSLINSSYENNLVYGDTDLPNGTYHIGIDFSVYIDKSFTTNITDNKHTHTINLKNKTNNSSEVRPKSKFFSLLIYAGYPMQ